MTHCQWCGRAFGCRCGTPVPSRQCSTHHCAMVIVSIPIFRFNGQFKEEKWVEYLQCPQPNCVMARSLKRSDGPRTANRKTTKKREHKKQTR